MNHAYEQSNTVFNYGIMQLVSVDKVLFKLDRLGSSNLENNECTSLPMPVVSSSRKVRELFNYRRRTKLIRITKMTRKIGNTFSIVGNVGSEKFMRCI